MKKFTITFTGSIEVEATEENEALGAAYAVLREEPEQWATFISDLEATEIRQLP